MTAVGDRWDAAWGRYAVHRLEGNQVVLADLAHPCTRFVLTTAAELAGGGRYRRSGQAAAEQLAIAPIAPIAPAPPPPARRTTCDDCGRSWAVLWHHGDPDDPTTLRFCSACLQGSPEAAQRAATLSSWRPDRAEGYDSRSEIGSYHPPADPAPARPRPAKPTRAEVRQLWPVATSGAPR